MRSFYLISAFIGAALVTACGGGGGSPGAPGGGVDVGTNVSTQLTADLRSSNGATIQSVAAGSSAEIVATLSTKAGVAIANQTVTAIPATTTGDQLLFFPSGDSTKTDASGIARIKVSRSNLYQFGETSFTLKFSGSEQYLTTTSSVVQVRIDPPVLSLVLRDASNLPTSVVAASSTTDLVATLRFADGTPVAQKRIDITTDLTKVAFPEGSSQLTNASGVAVVRVNRAANNNGGAGTFSGSTSISGATASGALKTTVVAGEVDFSIGAVTGAAKLNLTNLDLGAATLAAYGTRQVSVQANLGTLPATSPVQVSFSTSCGQIQPAIATTNASGLAFASLTATDAAGVTPGSLGCSGKNVEITASAVGADSIRKSVNVLVAPATNLAFVVPVDPSKLRIYLENSGGATQAAIQFLLTNALGDALPSQDVSVSLKTVNGGIPKATFGTKGNVNPVTVTTDSAGRVSIPVFAGTVPTNVIVNAALVSNPLVQTDSSVLTVASGRPAQARVSLSLGKFAIRGFNFDGEETTINMALADRQGNPVPDGTAVNFVTEGGVMIPPVCVTGGVAGDSRCTVKIRTQNPRPSNGRVSILAYSAGEEDFIDGNFNNVFDCGELFTDLGTAFRDDAALYSGVPPGSVYKTGAFAVPRSPSATSCNASATPTPTKGDGVWGDADVREQGVIVFSTDEVVVTDPVWGSSPAAQWKNSVVTSRLSVNVADLNGNSVPTGSTIDAVATDSTPKLPSDGDALAPTFGTCTLLGISHTTVPNSLDPLPFSVFLKDCYSGDQVKITVTRPFAVTSYTFSVP